MVVATDTLQQAKPRQSESAEVKTPLDRALNWIAFGVLTVVALAMFIPFAFSIATSLKSNREATEPLSFVRLFIPREVTFDAYQEVFEADIIRWFGNSVVVAAIWVIARAFTASTAGYAFARMDFPGKNLVFLLVLATMMIPGMVTVVPKFLILREIGLINTYGALTVPFMADAFGIFLMRQFFESIPVELEEAARVDGASRYRMFAQVILPNSTPALTALSIFSFQGAWNAFLEPLIFINSPKLYTLPLGLAYFRKANYTEWPTLMAIAVITTVPMAIFYLIFQRWFVEGQVSSGIKG
jgi:ABC-type glycerol-3-phosphate transport system permease component